MAREWERAHDRSYFWAKAGSSAPESGYVQQLRAEIARAKGLQVGSTLLDLVKCYEKVLHWVLIRGAKEHGFPLVVVRLCLAVYAGPRAISAAGCVSSVVNLGTSIVAGCGFATTLLKVVLIRCFDAAQLAFPEVSYFAYVDDSDLDIEGDPERIEGNLPGATKFVVHYLENVLHCPVSREKSVCLASTAGLRRSLALRLRTLGIGIGTRGKKLGVDFTANRRRTTAKARARWASACRRRPAVVALRRAGAKRGAVKVFKAGLMHASLYAAETHGISDTALHRMRSMSAQIGGAGGQGRSLLLTMLLGQDVGMDPAVTTTVRVVLAWASLIWESRLNRADLRLAVHAAILRQDAAKSPWATVNGPAGALVATLDRIGWVVIDESRWQDDQGLVLDLELICPRALAKLAERAVERWTTRRLAAKHEELRSTSGDGHHCQASFGGWSGEMVPTGALDTEVCSRPWWSDPPLARPALSCGGWPSRCCAGLVSRGQAPTVTDTGSVTAQSPFERLMGFVGMFRGLPGAQVRTRLWPA